MTVRDIRHHLASTIGVDLSAGTISKITDAVCDAVLQWQRRPLEAFLPRDLPRARSASRSAPTTRVPRPRWLHRRRSSRGRAVEHAGHLGPSR